MKKKNGDMGPLFPAPPVERLPEQPNIFADWLKSQKKRTPYKGVFWNPWMDKWCAVVWTGHGLSFDYFQSDGEAAEAFDKTVQIVPWMFKNSGDLNIEISHVA